MELIFKTKNTQGEPTFFPEKIWKSIQTYLTYSYTQENVILHGYDPEKIANHVPKIHTIRKDKYKRWRPGMTIQVRTGSRYGKRKTVCPDLICQHVDEFAIEYKEGFPVFRIGEIKLDFNEGQGDLMNIVAKLDGFNNIHGMLDFFGHEPFEGRMIHWTPFRYSLESLSLIKTLC